MLLCLNHHKEIDELYKKYSVDDLREIKREHELRIELATAMRPNKKSHVIIYRGNIGRHVPMIDIEDAMSAMFPDWYPVSRHPVILGLDNSAVFDDEDVFWLNEEQNLVRQFDKKVRPVLEAPGPNHFSIFAFATQPLLIKLGTLVPDLFPAIVYQLHREPPTWRWQNEPDEFDYEYRSSEIASPIVALNMSLSAPINDERIERVLAGQDYSIWYFSRKPFEGADTDFLKGPGQLSLFRKCFRQMLDEIKWQHGDSAEIHVFPSTPVSVAVEMGRVWQPKADLPMVIYDETGDGFVRALTIGEWE